MGGIVPILLKLSLLGSILAGLLLLLRPLFQRQSSKAFSYYLWLLVLLRLCVPVGLTIPLPPVEDTLSTPVEPAVTMNQTAIAPLPVQSKQESLPVREGQTDGNAAPIAPETQEPSSPSALPPPMRQTKLPSAAVLWTAAWLLGTVFFLGRYVWGYIRFSRTIRRSAWTASPEALALLRTLDPRGRVRLLESPLANTPMVLGAVRATIVLPVGVTGAARLGDILTHELTHVRRHDLLYKWFAAAVTSLHWFNPLMILVRREIGRACELSCDEAVMRGMDDAGRRHYGETLLALAASSNRLPALALCEEKERLKERLVSIVKYKKRGPAAVLLSLLLAVLIAGCAAISGAQPAPAPSERSNAENPDVPPEDIPGLLEDVTLYEANGMTIAFPNDIYDQLLIFPSEDEGTLVEVYEKASYEAAQADFGETASGGFLFSLTRRDQAGYEQFLMTNDVGMSFFARDDTYYYGWGVATDVQLYRSRDLFTEEEMETWQTIGRRVEDIKGDFTARNGLTCYDDSEFFARDFAYSGEHLYAGFSNTSLPMTLVLSQPVRKGEDGIWCVERWYDNDTGNGYYTFYMEGYPQIQGITAAEHYQQLQDEANAGARPDLLDPRQAATVWLQNYFSDMPGITVMLDDVTILEGEPGGNVWDTRIAPVLMEKGSLETVVFLNGGGYMPYGHEMPAYWAEQNLTLVQVAGSRLRSILWCKAEPQTRNGAAVQYCYMRDLYMSAPDSSVIFFEDGLICVQRDDSQRNGGQGRTEEWFRPLYPSVNPYEVMYSICQEWANYVGNELRFSSEEVNAAIDTVMAKFEEWSDYCILDQCSYDPAYSLRRVQGYLNNGRGSVNGVAKENVIVLIASFTTLDGEAVQGTGWEPDATYQDYNFILIREDAQSPWVLDDWGY